METSYCRSNRAVWAAAAAADAGLDLWFGKSKCGDDLSEYRRRPKGSNIVPDLQFAV